MNAPEDNEIDAQGTLRSVKVAALLALVHVVLAMLYAHVTPFETPGVLMHQRDANGPIRVIDVGAPDELQHMVYVRRLAKGEGLPVLDPKDPDLGRNYQSHQPPLYYALAAGWTKVFGDSALGVRSLNAFIGGLTVLGAFCLALWSTGSGAAAFGAGAFVALLPMNVALSGAASNDPLLFCLCTWALAMAIYFARDGLCVKRSIVLGAVIGLACLTKTTAIAVFPAVLVALWMGAERPRPSRLAIVMGVGVLVAAGWWVRNTQLYGDPLAMGVFGAAFSGSPKAAMFIDTFGAPTYWMEWVGWWTLRSFVGVFGYMDVFLPTPVYGVGFGAIVLVGLLGLLTALRREQAAFRPATLANALFLALILGLFVMFNRTYFQGQARYLFPAIGPIAVAIGLGLASLVERRSWVGPMAAAIALLVLNIYVLSVLPGEFAARTVQTNAASKASN